MAVVELPMVVLELRPWPYLEVELRESNTRVLVRPVEQQVEMDEATE